VGEIRFGAGRAVPLQSGDDPAQVGDGGRQVVRPAGTEHMIGEMPDQVVVPLRQLPPGRPSPGRGHELRGSVEEPAVQVGQPGLAHLVDQVGPDHVVQPNRSRVVPAFQDEGQAARVSQVVRTLRGAASQSAAGRRAGPASSSQERHFSYAGTRTAATRGLDRKLSG
jgi:hypothetical protein